MKCAVPECKFKLEWTSMECRCGKKFCRRHVYSFDHKCTYDYLAEHKQLIQSHNQSIIRAKVDHI